MAMPAQPIYEIPPLLPQRWGSAVANYLRPELGEERWPGGGITYVPLGCPSVRALVEDPCVQLSWAAPEGFEAAVNFAPFRIEETLTCSTLGAWSPEEMELWAKREATPALSVGLARRTMWGAYGPGQSSLAANSTDVTLGGDLSVVGALAAVELALGQRLLGQGMVHVTPAMLVRLKAAGAVTMVDDVYYTPTGHIVVADYGYYSDQATAYIYGSGMVSYQATDWQVTTGWKTVHNDLIVYANAWAVVWFEPCPLVRAQTNAATPTNNYGV
jgi:hypothetical protein